VPDHPFLEKISTLNYQEIANEILEERENLQLPPFVHHINIHAESLNKNLPENVLHKICKFLKMNETQFIGPKPAIIEKRKKYFRWVLTLKSADRKKIHHLANRTLAFIETQNFINKVRISIDVDPIS
jgi:primosomal protein N' (replication factor Y)